MINKKFTLAAVAAAAIAAAPVAAPVIGAVAPVFAATSTSNSYTADRNSTEIVVKDVFTAGSKGAPVYSSPAATKPTSRVLAAGTKWKSVGQLDNGILWYDLGNHEWVRGLDGAAFDSAATKDTTSKIGIGTINYNKNYGIQVWTKDGKTVKFNKTDADSWNKKHPNTKVKVGDPKKLPGQTSWRVFNDTYKANGTTYYNLGGNQYIDASYVILKK
ncbi:SLAP domain-containing protein [Lacticaseibacillus zhaodongensis]|uniref:SLAP domain-containing protein n=1 Tax=Lacticaseibacillus zhaodongensis TaxID=2668065 RepID=UPI0012D367F6|nr:SLAP domain-containing protein [Lacticaseibacillus zhaodongensis]